MAAVKEKAILLFWAVCLQVDTGSGSCMDLDVTGCRRNPQFCHDALLAEVTCPVMCNRCPTVPQTTPSASSALECYSCQNVKKPSTCNQTQMCGLGQSCFMETTVTAHEVLYHMGCLSNKMCTLSGNVPGIVGRSIETRQQTSCHECCSGSLCNNQLCSTNDCSDVLRLGLSRGSGVYRITPWNTQREVDVYCDMDTDGGGWTVFQRRLDGSVNFNRSFADYEQGFGSLDGEFWLGLSLLYSMTSRDNMTLRVDVSLQDGTTGFDEYSGFFISDPDHYVLNVNERINSIGMMDIGLLSENDDRYATNHQPFLTYDRNVHNWTCVYTMASGWWVKGCSSNPNGAYNSSLLHYMALKTSYLHYSTVKTASMMFRMGH